MDPNELIEVRRKLIELVSTLLGPVPEFHITGKQEAKDFADNCLAIVGELGENLLNSTDRKKFLYQDKDTIRVAFFLVYLATPEQSRDKLRIGYFSLSSLIYPDFKKVGLRNLDQETIRWLTTMKKGPPPLEEIETESTVFGSYGGEEKLLVREGFDWGSVLYIVYLVCLIFLVSLGIYLTMIYWI